MMEPYSYVITWYPTQEQVEKGEAPIIIAHGILVSSSTFDAYVKMVDMVSKGEDVEQVQFMAKPFLESKSCSTKKELGKYYLQNFYMDNDTAELYNTTYNINDLIKNSFNYNNDYSYPRELPNVMMMVDILALINNDKKL